MDNLIKAVKVALLLKPPLLHYKVQALPYSLISFFNPALKALKNGELT
jgi:hypothetical protein